MLNFVIFLLRIVFFFLLIKLYRGMVWVVKYFVLCFYDKLLNLIDIFNEIGEFNDILGFV